MNNHKQVKDMLKNFYPFAKKRFGFNKPAKIILNPDQENSQKPLGKTAFYDPQNHSVTVYTHSRHPKDIMRSISHELVHHTQNCRGDLTSVAGEQGQGYAQNNEHLREMEREAYEQGNLCFRDWEDGIKSNLEPGTIYEKRSITTMATVKDHLKKRDALRVQRLFEKFGYKAPMSEDWQDDPMGGMSGEDYDQSEALLRDTIGDILDMEGTSVGAIQSTQQLARLVGQVLQQPGIEEAGYDEDDIMMAVGEMQQEKSGGGAIDRGYMEEPEDGHASPAHYQESSDDIREKKYKREDKEEKLSDEQSDEMDKDKDGDIDGEDLKALRKNENERNGVAEQSAGMNDPAMLPDDVKIMGGKTMKELIASWVNKLEADAINSLNLSDDQDAQKFIDAFGDPELVDDVLKFMKDKAMGNKTKASPTVAHVAKGVKRDYNIGENLAESLKAVFAKNPKLIKVLKESGLSNKQIIKKVLEEYGDHETQAQGGMVSSSRSSDPEFDQIVDIVRTVIEKGGSLHDLKQPLEAEAFDVQSTSQFVLIKTTNGDIAIASTKNVELSGDEELIDTPYGQLAVGRINQNMEEIMTEDEGGMPRMETGPGGVEIFIPGLGTMSEQGGAPIYLEKDGNSWELLVWSDISSEEPTHRIDLTMAAESGNLQEGESRHRTPDFFGSDDEKEMMKKMSNKEFYKYVTRDRHVVPDLKGDMDEIPGMEGPFQFKSGAVLYYDPKAGKYYDRGKDMYLDNEEASSLTMEQEEQEDQAGSGDEVAAAKEKGMKSDVQKVAKFMFNHKQLGPALERLKGDNVEVAQLLALLSQEMGVDPDNLGTLVTKVKGAMKEAEGDVFKAGDKVVDDRNGQTGTVTEPMAGGAVIKLDDGEVVKVRDKFLSKAEPTVMKEFGEEDYSELTPEQIDMLAASLSEETTDEQLSEMGGSGMSVEQFADAFDLTPQRDNDGQILFNAVADGGIKDQEIMKQAELAGFDIERDSDGAMVIYTGQSGLKEMYGDDPYEDEDPYMAGLEAEFPWMKDKKKGRRASAEDDDAMAAAMADAAGEYAVPPEDEEEDEFADPLQEWWNIRNDRKASKFFEWAVKNK